VRTNNQRVTAQLHLIITCKVSPLRYYAEAHKLIKQ
jgi:hypothetical protein